MLSLNVLKMIYFMLKRFFCGAQFVQSSKHFFNKSKNEILIIFLSEIKNYNALLGTFKLCQ